MRTTLPWLAPLLLLLLACDAAPPAGGVVLRPGDLLLDHAGAMAVDRYPRTNLPAELVEPVAGLSGSDGWTIPGDAWTARGPQPEAAAFAEGLGFEEELLRWDAPTSVDLDLGLGQLWFRHEGHELTRDTTRPGERRVLFYDLHARLIFWWDPQSRLLCAYGRQAPGEVRYGFRAADGFGLQLWERRLVAGVRRPRLASELQARVRLGRRARPCLAAPAVTELRLPVESFGGTGLSLSLSVVDLGLALEDDHLLRAERASNGVVFAVEVDLPEGRQQVWSRSVPPGTAFVEATIDLAAYAGRRLDLLLVTRPGREGDRSFDYGLWSDLRVLGEPRAPPARPHVVVVDVDTLRADRLGCYGYERPTTPRIDAWAAACATVFSDCSAAGNWTLPSTASLLTGLPADRHGVVAFDGRVTAGMRPLAVRLKQAGYETWARTAGGYVSPVHGFAEGFDAFEFLRRPAQEHQQVGWQPELAAIAARRSERPLFAFLHTYQVHDPWLNDGRFEDPARPYEGRLSTFAISPRAVLDHAASQEGGLLPAEEAYVHDVYDAAVARMDDVVGAFLEGLDEAFRGEPYMVVLTSDHGEELLERGGMGHAHSLHRELLAVPLIVRWPAGDRVGTDPRPVSGLDVLPTILEAVGLPVDPALPGLPLGQGELPERLLLATHGETGWAAIWGDKKLVTGRWDGSGSDGLALFDRARDPWERHDLSSEHGQAVESLRRRLEEYLARHPRLAAEATAPSHAPLPDELAEDLEALGYLDR